MGERSTIGFDIAVDDPDSDAARERYLDQVLSEVRSRRDPGPDCSFRCDLIGNSHWLGTIFVIAFFPEHCELRMFKFPDGSLPGGFGRGVTAHNPMRFIIRKPLSELRGEDLVPGLATYVATEVLDS